jgi:hypothetical protein
MVCVRGSLLQARTVLCQNPRAGMAPMIRGIHPVQVSAAIRGLLCAIPLLWVFTSGCGPSERAQSGVVLGVGSKSVSIEQLKEDSEFIGRGIDVCGEDGDSRGSNGSSESSMGI